MDGPNTLIFSVRVRRRGQRLQVWSPLYDELYTWRY